MSEEISYKKLLDAMPGKIRNRFLSLAKYTFEIVREYQDERGMLKRKRLKRDSIRVIQIAVFVFVLRKFFEDGSRAAKYAVRAFREIDVDGFTVGEILFSGNNENVRMGKILSQKLEQALGETSLWSSIISASSTRSLVNTLTEEALEYG